MNSAYNPTSLLIDETISDTITSLSTTTDVTDQTAWPTIATVIYLSLYILLVIIISIYVHKTENYDKKKDFIYAIWSRKSIYGQILVHLYDTATDVGVLVEWGRLAYDDTDYESIDMYIMFWTSIGFILCYRILSSMLAAVQSLVSDDFDDKSESMQYLSCCSDCCLGIFDMYIIKTVWKSLKLGHEEPTPQQKASQLMESIFESLPQV